MIDWEEIEKLMGAFVVHGCFINHRGEMILSKVGNVYFTISECKTRNDIVKKLLEWCSRPMAKGSPYSSETHNQNWRRSMILSLNNYLGTQFNGSDLWVIYDRLGNAVDRELTIQFINSDFDMEVLKRRTE